MAIDSLKDIYIDQLQDLYSADQQAAKVVGELAGKAKNPELKDALQEGEKGIRKGLETLSGILRDNGEDPEGEFCKGMEGLVKEARAHALEEEITDDDARDAMIITQYQRMVHYAIAGYGCVAAFARRLERDQEAEALQACLQATYGGDDRMTRLATGGINQAAR